MCGGNFEVKVEECAISTQVPDVPAEIRERCDDGLELVRHLGRCPGLVIDGDRRRVEVLHPVEVVSVAEYQVFLVQRPICIFLARHGSLICPKGGVEIKQYGGSNSKGGEPEIYSNRSLMGDFPSCHGTASAL